MKKILFILFIILVGFLGSCELSLDGLNSNDTTKPTDTTKPSDETKPIVPVRPTVNVKFYNGDTLLANQDFEKGSVIEFQNLETQDNETYHFEFLGWDANNDNQVETFPYSLDKDVVFKAVIKQEYINYEYTIYDKDEIVRHKEDAHYGEAIDYPEIQSHWQDDNVYLFLGWEYDGVFDGYQYLNVSKNTVIRAKYADTQVFKLYFKNSKFAQIFASGSSLEIPSEWNVVASEGFELKYYLDSEYTQSFNSTVMPEGNLTLYCREEEIIYVPENYVEVSNKESLVQEFNLAQLDRAESKSFKINYSYSSIDELTSYIVDKALQLYPYSLSSSMSGPYLTVNLNYEDIAYLKTDEVIYQQIDCVNVLAYPNTRSNDYNDFAAEKRTKELNVHSSDALYYALEHDYKPIIESTDIALNSLYNKMKDVLRQIISNDMDDFTKARAIYEYLIMNVTYDGKLLNIVKTDQVVTSKYRSFYLEGVFEDKVAVCDGISKAYSALCQMEGINCVRVTGTIVESAINHAWNKILLDNKWYIVDPTSGGYIVDNNELLTYAFFLLSEEEYKDYALSDNIYYSECKCENEYDVYSKIMLGENNAKAENKDQAAAILQYLLDSDKAKCSVDLVLEFEYDDIKTLLGELLTQLEDETKVLYSQMFGSLSIFK